MQNKIKIGDNWYAVKYEKLQPVDDNINNTEILNKKIQALEARLSGTSLSNNVLSNNVLTNDNLRRNDLRSSQMFNNQQLSNSKFLHPRPSTLEVEPIKEPKHIKPKKPIKEPKKVVTSNLPLCYEKNINLLQDIEELIDTEELSDVIEFKNALDYGKYKGDVIEKKTFNDIKTLVTLFSEINEDIVAIDEGKLKKRSVKRPATKIKKVKTLYSNVKNYLEII